MFLVDIQCFGRWGNPYEQARRANDRAHWDMEQRIPRARPGASAPPGMTVDPNDLAPHGIPAHKVAELRDRFENFMPGIAGKQGATSRAARFFDGMLPPGAQLSPGAGQGYAAAMAKSTHLRKRGQSMGGGSFGGGGFGGGAFFTPQTPYQPEFASPERQNYPVARNLANIYWRLFYKMDHLIGSGIDMFSELPWSNFELTGDGVDGEIKSHYERMCEVTQIRAMLPYFVREYLVVGEACPQLIYDDDEGMWTYIGMHNPDQLEVIHTPFFKMDPIVRFKPDTRLRQVLTANHEMTRAVRESMPPELLSAVMSGQPIELSPLNFTFIPRKMHPYDVRGTSIISRMWRVLMLEDAIYNASIAIARRNAAPLKVAKLGDPQTGWIPPPDQERRLLELLTLAESDPAAWLTFHYGIAFELVGTQERAWKIEQSSEFIERVKLMALGLSKSFTYGEVTYASAASGLTVFLQRLRTLREFFESIWIMPKFFRPIARMNAFVKPTPAELSHRVRTRRSHQELIDDDRYIVPQIEWDRSLDPSIDSAMIQAVSSIEQLGVKFSKQTKMSLVNRDWEDELRQAAREARIEQEILAEYPELQMQLQPPDASGGGGGIMPGLPPGPMPGDEGMPDEGGGTLPPEMPAMEDGQPPEMGAGLHADEGELGGPGRWDDRSPGQWGRAELDDLARLLEGSPPSDEPWTRMVEDWIHDAAAGDKQAQQALGALKQRDADAILDFTEDYLIDEGYPAKSISDLKAFLSMRMRQPATMAPRARRNFERRLSEIEKKLDRRDELLPQLRKGEDRMFVGAHQWKKRAV